MKRNKIYYLGVVLLLAGCSRDMAVNSDYLSGETKTPLTIEASLSETPLTRAAGKEFASGDVLLAYIRHIDNTDAAVANYNSIMADQAPRLVSFTKGSASMEDANANDGIKETSDLTASYTSTSLTNVSALYWDDFSNSNSTDTDLRTANHGLQSYYGYCYNGGTPTTALTKSTGVLGWTIAADQSESATVVKQQDLLWSPAQTAVTYAHSTAVDATNHGTLTIPYTHAMSEITVTLTAGTGFSGSPLTNTALTLNAMNTVASLTAPTSTVTSETPASIKMYGETYTSGLTRNFTAIVAPRTKLKVDELLLSIVNVDDNNYELKISSTMLGDEKWASGHEAADKGTENGKAYILTKPGYNYHLDVTVNKTEVSVRATIKYWTTVTASGTGDVQYDDDYTDLVMDDSEPSGEVAVSTLNVSNSYVKDASAFTLFWMSTTTDDAAAVTSTTNDSYSLATVSTFNGTNTVWTNSPTIYWPNKSTNYYFRALAKYKGKESTTDILESAGTEKSTAVAVSQGTMADGHDYLWATTAKHYGNNKNKTYNRGQAISPRTGDVPMAFEHAMAKIKFILTTTSDESVTVNNPKVDLTGATVTVSGINTTGTISIETGAITGDTSGSTPALAQLAEYIVIPQTLVNDAKVTVTLADDGTTYKLQLNQCLDKQSTPAAAIGTWERGKFYTYTIHLEKEQITFRALIKDWEEVTGSGNGNLEWD